MFFIVFFISLSLSQTGTCGTDCTWNIENEILTITGNGEMDNFSHENMSPWYQYSSIVSTDFPKITSSNEVQ